MVVVEDGTVEVVVVVEVDVVVVEVDVVVVELGAVVEVVPDPVVVVVLPPAAEGAVGFDTGKVHAAAAQSCGWVASTTSTPGREL